jgi:hypothetical protein
MKLYHFVINDSSLRLVCQLPIVLVAQLTLWG